MHRLRIALLATVSASAIAFGAALPASAAAIPEPAPIVRAWQAPRQEHPEGESGAGGDNTKILLWSISGVAAGGVVMGTLYLLKRRVGAFPKNPTWVAPISIMESKTFADEGTFGDAQSEGHHAPAHH